MILRVLASLVALVMFAVIAPGAALYVALLWVKVHIFGALSPVHISEPPDDDLAQIEAEVAMMTLRQAFGAGAHFAWREANDDARILFGLRG